MTAMEMTRPRKVERIICDVLSDCQVAELMGRENVSLEAKVKYDAY